MYAAATLFLFLNFFPAFFDAPLAWEIALFSTTLQTACVAAAAFQLLSNKELLYKSIFAVIAIFLTLEGCLNLFYGVTDCHGYDIAYYSFFAVFFAAIIYTKTKKYSFKSDAITSPNVYFCFWRPKKGAPLLSSLFGAPFGGVSIYADDHLYGFRWDKQNYCKQRVGKRIVERAFVVVDSGIQADSEKLRLLESFVGKHAGRFRNRCILTITPLLHEMGKRYVPSVSEMLPSRFYLMVKNER